MAGMYSLNSTACYKCKCLLCMKNSQKIELTCKNGKSRLLLFSFHLIIMKTASCLFHTFNNGDKFVIWVKNDRNGDAFNSSWFRIIEMTKYQSSALKNEENCDLFYFSWLLLS